MLTKKKLQEDMKKLQADLDKVTEAISKSVIGKRTQKRIMLVNQTLCFIHL